VCGSAPMSTNSPAAVTVSVRPEVESSRTRFSSFSPESPIRGEVRVQPAPSSGKNVESRCCR
jgi:hypothetical protein